jgi:diguanylate cyclase (GGDEF)-like protein
MNDSGKPYSEINHLERSIHALHLYQDYEQMIGMVIPLITDGIELNEKCIFIGAKKACAALEKKFKSKISTLSPAVPAAEFVKWVQTEIDRTDAYTGLRIFVENIEEYLQYEEVIDDLVSGAETKLFLICLYAVDALTANQFLDLLKSHGHVLVDHLLRPNSFYSRVKHRIWVDPLTGLFNKRYLENQLSRELQRASRYEHNLSILCCDIDNFVAINDEFGHEVGDRILEELASILKKNFRSIDIVARYGSDEFIVLLPETDRNRALNTGTRVVEQIKNYDFFKDELQVREMNVSVGVASFPEDAGGTFELIKKAHNALLKAKKEGGGRALLCT